MEEVKRPVLVKVGDYDLDVDEGTEQMIGVQTYIMHEDYEESSDADVDVAILKLMSPIEFSETVQPANLPYPDEEFEGTAVVLGWGWQNNGISHPRHLQKTELGLETDYDDYYLDEDILVTETRDSGVCHGDSGGPLVCDEDVICGIVSRPLRLSREDECHPQYPEKYCRVSSHIDFIEENMENY